MIRRLICHNTSRCAATISSIGYFIKGTAPLASSQIEKMMLTLREQRDYLLRQQMRAIQQELNCAAMPRTVK